MLYLMLRTGLKEGQGDAMPFNIMGRSKELNQMYNDCSPMCMHMKYKDMHNKISLSQVIAIYHHFKLVFVLACLSSRGQLVIDQKQSATKIYKTKQSLILTTQS